MLRWLKTVVVSDEEKAPVEASGGDREGERERIVADVPKPLDDIGTGCFGDSGMSLADIRLLARWCPACRRREPAASAKVAAARRILTLIFYGLRDGQIRCLSRPPASQPAAQAAERAA